MLGLDFPSTGERLRRLDEACTVIKKLWTEPKADYEGRYYRLEEALAEPKPVQRPHPPIWIGGSGERKTLRIVAEHADVWNFGGGPVETAVQKNEVLDRHCADVGRDPAQIRRSVQLRCPTGGLDPLLSEIDQFVAAGFTEVVVIVAGQDAVAMAEDVARVILPRFRD
jgi:alkanesulfonate monooxygenase SsuD/methylene tetrahydromethanopterin reductase-like flavin-dependent oxidoreductase (luciferase family)